MYGKHRIVFVGWHDEMDSRDQWGALDMENKAFTAAPTKGTIFLGLDRAPANWPYGYQWSGVTRDLYVDVARFPMLMARVIQVQGYAHLDIDVLDAKSKAINTLRSNTLTAPGISSIDLGRLLPPGQAHLRLRLIVGGPNEGCCATYDWVRFVNKVDADFLTKDPDWGYVRMHGMMLR
ncbi:hypothetical protein OP10G_1211 [Fimbriimonas ginsengisoli Gsoil 348]|uniref:Uncharacterized protein n=2 Tax=Fimbriimonas ginsengisoli TaxID=1005039 RepID=A0A068NSL6_FIMGI|nr:hypothetical protein OP10G_1211 [Fimbriimonas ginsengisoli Gsoil 348]